VKRIQIPEDLIGDKVLLREVMLSDCNDSYLNWLNDPEVNRFLETRFSVQSINAISDFVCKMNSTSDTYLCAIIHRKSEQHIGNIKVGPIHPFYRRADLSYFIGNHSMWGHGCGSEAVEIMTRFAFRDLGVRKLKAFIREFNVGSRRVLERNGFQLEGVLKKEERYERGSEWEDVYAYGLFADDFRSPEGGVG